MWILLCSGKKLDLVHRETYDTCGSDQTVYAGHLIHTACLNCTSMSLDLYHLNCQMYHPAGREPPVSPKDPEGPAPAPPPALPEDAVIGNVTVEKDEDDRIQHRIFLYGNDQNGYPGCRKNCRGWKRAPGITGSSLRRSGNSIPGSPTRGKTSFRNSRGTKNPEVKDLDLRFWTCPVCGHSFDRDYNAAVNIREEGKRIFLEYVKEKLDQKEQAEKRYSYAKAEKGKKELFIDVLEECRNEGFFFFRSDVDEWYFINPYGVEILNTIYEINIEILWDTVFKSLLE